MAEGECVKQLGHFAIEELLGDGGMSIVWGAEHLVLGTKAAIKVLRPEYADREPHRSAFFAEARSHAKLSHPGILRILDVGEVDEAGADALQGTRAGAPFIVMERASGTLDEDLPFAAWTPVYTVLLEVMDALAHAHARGVVHRDLKPGNVMRVDRPLGGYAYRIGDFGLAHGRDSTGEAEVAMGPTAGTPMYMAPEQINGYWRDFGPETDLYALGCLAYRLVCGRPPFDGETLFQIVTGHTTEPPPQLEPLFAVPDALQQWIWRLLEKSPYARFRRAADAAHALREICQRFRDPASSFVDLPTPVWTFGAETLVDEDFQPSGRIVAPGAARSAMAGDGLGLFDLAEGPLVGREAESQLLRSRLLAARDVRGASVVILRGKAGVGLTRLARAFATRMDELGLAFVHEATHTPVQAAHEGLPGMLEAHFGTWGLDREEVWDRVHTQLTSPNTTVPADVAAAVSEIISRSREPADGPSYRFRTSRERSALVDSALRFRHEDRPRLYFFDDAQWGRETLEFVRDRVEADVQAVFVLTIRDESLPNTFADGVLAELIEDPNTTVIDLEPPSLADVVEFVASLLEFAPGTPQQIADAAGQDFRFARQLVGHLLESDELIMGNDGFSIVASDTPLPADWETLWTLRLAKLLEDCGLDDDALAAFELAAELGHYPEPGELARALEIAGVPLETRLHEMAASRGFLISHGDGWAFALRSLTEHLRGRSRASGRVQRWSEVCVRAIGVRSMTRGRASRIAWHHIQGGDLEGAFEPLRIAIRGYATANPDRADELLGWWSDNCKELGYGKTDHRRIDHLLMSANVAQVRGQAERCRSLVDKALRRSRRVNYERGEAWALLRTGQAAVDDGELQFALDRFRRAEGKFRRVAEHHGRGHSLFGAGFCEMRLGNLATSISDYRAAIEIFETLGDLERAIGVMSYLAYSYMVLGNFDEAEAYCHRSIEDAQRIGDRAVEFESTSTLAEIARMRGDFDRARDYLEEVVQWRRTLGQRDAVIAEFNLALTELGANNFARANEILTRCEEEVIARGVEGRLPLVLVALAVAALGLGDLGRYQHFWERAAPSFAQPSFMHIDVQWCAEVAVKIARQNSAPAIAARWQAVAAEQRRRLQRG